MSKVCLYFTVATDELFGLKNAGTVFHLKSNDNRIDVKFKSFCSDWFCNRSNHHYMYISLYVVMYITRWFDFVTDEKWTVSCCAPLPNGLVCYCQKYEFPADVFL